MTRPPSDRLPGEPRSDERDYGPLGGLADDVHAFVKERQRNEDALARSMGRSRLAGRGLGARVRSLLDRLRR